MSAPCPSAERRTAARATIAGHVLGAPALGRRHEPGQRADPADPLQGPPQLRLEHDDEREQADDGARLEDLRQEAQLERLGRRVDREEDADADDEPDGARPADQAEQPVDQQRP